MISQTEVTFSAGVIKENVDLLALGEMIFDRELVSLQKALAYITVIP